MQPERLWHGRVGAPLGSELPPLGPGRIAALLERAQGSSGPMALALALVLALALAAAVASALAAAGAMAEAAAEAAAAKTALSTVRRASRLAPLLAKLRERRGAADLRRR